MKELLKSAISSNTCISSKRICGCLGWMVAIVIIVYCTITGKPCPEIMDTFILGIMGLLGIDSVTNIWKKK